VREKFYHGGGRCFIKSGTKVQNVDSELRKKRNFEEKENSSLSWKNLECRRIRLD